MWVNNIHFLVKDNCGWSLLFEKATDTCKCAALRFTLGISAAIKVEVPMLYGRGESTDAQSSPWEHREVKQGPIGKSNLLDSTIEPFCPRATDPVTFTLLRPRP